MSNFPPIFHISVHFPPVSRKLLFPPYFEKFPPCFQNIHLLFTYFMCISFPPYFDHDAVMHHPMHVLDAPAGLITKRYKNWINLIIIRVITSLLFILVVSCFKNVSQFTKYPPTT